MLPKYSALGKKKLHRHTIICIITQDSLDLTRPLVGLAASFLSGKPKVTSAASACRSRVAGGAAAAACSRGKRGLALTWRSRKPFPSLPQMAKVLQEMEHYRKEEPALGPTFTTYRGFPYREQGWAASLCLKVLEAAQMLSDRGDFDWASDRDFHFNARQEEPTYHSICRNEKVVTNLHVYGISLAETIYIYIYKKTTNKNTLFPR